MSAFKDSAQAHRLAITTDGVRAHGRDGRDADLAPFRQTMPIEFGIEPGTSV